MNQPLDPEQVRDRIRRFLLPVAWSESTVYAGTSNGHSKCDVCQQDIRQGSCEYELDFQGTKLLLDRSCFAVWQTEKMKR